jgi:outer membrane biosynthesis protein TonB
MLDELAEIEPPRDKNAKAKAERAEKNEIKNELKNAERERDEEGNGNGNGNGNNNNNSNVKDKKKATSSAAAKEAAAASAAAAAAALNNGSLPKAVVPAACSAPLLALLAKEHATLAAGCTTAGLDYAPAMDYQGEATY